MSILKWTLIVAAGGYVVVVALMYVFQRSLLYIPDVARVSPAAAGLPAAEEVILDTADHEKVITWHVPPRGDKPVVLHFYGNAGSLALCAQRFRRLTADGTGLVGLDYRGYGGSTGSPTEAGLKLDAEAVYAFAAARYPVARIIVWGESLGTGVAVALAAERPVAGLILEKPFTSAVDVAARVYPWLPVRALMKDPFRSDLLIANIRAPVLVLHGGRDQLVPIAMAERLYGLIPGPKTFVRFAEGDHNDLDAHGAIEAIHRFLDGLDRPASAAQ